MDKLELNKIIDDFFQNFNDGLKESILLNLNLEELILLKKIKIINILKKRTNLTPVGKRTIRYWLERGWSEKEAKIKSKDYSIKRDSSKSPMNKIYWMNKGYSEDEAVKQIKSQRKSNIEYWMKKGFNEDDAVEEVKKFQKSNNKNLLEKISNGLIDVNYNNRLGYFLKQGFTEDEAKIKLTERQSTFSKDICIKKYGEEDGLKIWRERQIKWQKSLNISYIDQSNKNSKSVDFFISKYGEKWYEHALEELSLSKDVKDVLNKFKNENNIRNIIKYYIDNYVEKSTKNLSYFYRKFCLLKIIQFKFKLSYKELIKIFFELMCENIYVKNVFGKLYYYQDYILKSKPEYDLVKFLIEKNIDFIYEPKYPNSNKRFDFYIKNIDLYIEYIGLINCSIEKIKKKYQKIINEKKAIVKINNINCLFETNIEKIIEKIEYEIKNKNI